MMSCFVGRTAAAQAGPRPLTAAQVEAVERGERVIVTESRTGSPWPAVRVYAYIQAAPEKAAAVFADYESHLLYVPGVKRSEISKRIDESTFEVDYTISVPIVRDEEYTVRNRVAPDSAGVIRIDWTLVRATSTRATVGYARFSSYVHSRTRKSGTLLEYYNFVTPGSRMAAIAFIRNRAISQVDETVEAIVRRVEGRR